MKKLLQSILLAICLVTITACSGNTAADLPEIIVENYSVKYFYNENKNEFNLSAAVKNGGENAEIKWKSSDETVATVTDGDKVKFLKDGSCDITAYLSGNEKVSKSVTLTGEYLSVAIEDKISFIDVYYGITSDLRYTANGNYTDYTWSSSDETVATIDENGKVTAAQTGVTVISIEKSDCSYVFDSFLLTVKDSTDDIEEEELSNRLAGIKYRDMTVVAGKPTAEIYRENDEISGLDFGAKTAGENRARFTALKTLENGHKYVLSFTVDKTGENSLWGNFGFGIRDIITLNSSYSPTMWGYVNGSNPTSHDATSKNAKNVIIRATHENYTKYKCGAEFVMTSDVEEIIFDMRMNSATVGSNAVIREITLTEDENYYIEAQKDGALKTLLNGIGLTNAKVSVGNPEFSCLMNGDKVEGLKVGSKGVGEIRFTYAISKTLEAGKTYKVSFTINKVGSVGLWGNFQTGIKDIVRLATPDNGYFPSLWGYANNSNPGSHATSTDYAENVKLTGSPSGSTTFNETATFTMLQNVDEMVVDFRILDCQAGDMFTITAFNVQEIVNA